MHNITDNESRPLPQSGSVDPRAPMGPRHSPAQPSLTSGFGTVLEKEHDLQAEIESSVGHVRGRHSTEIDRILHHQHSRLGANIALLEQRYETLPNPERFVSWHDRSRPPANPRLTDRDETELLPDLIAQHTNLLGDIQALIGCAPDSQRSERILTEVSHNHEEMAWMLTALLKEDETIARSADDGGDHTSGTTSQAQENWDNEGGPMSVNPPAS